MIKVVHCKKEPYDVYIGRPSKWGNPFVIGFDKDGSRLDVVRKYYDWILTQEKLLNDLDELKDKTLACWCSPSLCHGHVLKALVEKDTEFLQNIKKETVEEYCARNGITDYSRDMDGVWVPMSIAIHAARKTVKGELWADYCSHWSFKES